MLITGRYLLVVFSDMVSTYRPFPVLIFLTVNTYCSPLVPFTFDQEYRIRLPFIALTSIILNGYFSPGIIVTTSSRGWPAGPINRTLVGVIVTSFSTSPVTVSASLGCSGSFVSIEIFFLILLPPYFLVSVLMVIFPSPPGGICLV